MEATLDLRKWHLFNLLEPNILTKIKFAWVFGKTDKICVLFITKNDEVWGFGNGFEKYIDIPAEPTKPTLIEYFKDLKIKRFSFGNESMTALTEEGQIYNCGKDGESLGRYSGHSTSRTTPTKIPYGIPNDVKIVEVACGARHTLALSSTGQVFTWGYDYNGVLGRGSEPYYQSDIPAVVDGIAVDSTTFPSSISCGLYSSYVILNDGQVYSWGKTHSNTIDYRPELNVYLSNDFISKIVCGTNHTMALSERGVLYTWGRNDFGELGTGNQSAQRFPKKLRWSYERIIDIAAMPDSQISVAMTCNSEIFVWGKCRGSAILEPRLTPFTSVHEVFLNLNEPAVSFGIIENIHHTVSPTTIMEKQTNINHTLRTAFNDPEFSDFKIQIKDQLIHVHRTILILRCKYFQALFANEWKEKKENVMIVQNRTYSVYKEFLKYLYTDKVNVTLEESFELLNIAQEYMDENLKDICTQIMKYETTIQNVALVYNRANAADLQEWKKFSLLFMFKNLKAVTLSPEFKNLELEIQVNILHKAAECDLFKT